MNEVSSHELKVAELIVESLNLEDIVAADIEPDAALFGEGLGLDSIDALEISLALSNQYGVQLRSDDTENPRIFASLRTLSEHIEKHRTQ